MATKLTLRLSAVLSAVTTLTVAAWAQAGGVDPSNVQVELRQFNVQVDAGNFPNTPWGGAVVTHGGFPQPMFFNLSVDGRWVVRNMPVFSNEGVGNQHLANFAFDWQIPMGQNKQNAMAGFRMSPVFMVTPPQSNQFVTVRDGDVRLFSGEIGWGPIGFSPPGNQAGESFGPVTNLHKDFPNQEQGENECTPGAVSNSLKWLKEKNGLTIPDEALSIGAVGGALGTEPDGTPGDWPTRKDAYLRQLAQQFGAGNLITTTVLAGNDLAGLAGAINDGADVEASLYFPGGGAHTIAIVGVVKNADGTYTIEFKHDLKQGAAGGTEGTHTITVDANGVVTVGATGIPVGTRIGRFVKEQVAKPRPVVNRAVID